MSQPIPKAARTDIRPSTVDDRRAGFTFVEVLFAIIILGIGMIMIAGVLPVAIKQNSDTRDDLTGKALVESGYAYVRSAIEQNPGAFTPTPSPVTGMNIFDAGTETNTAADLTAGRVMPLNFNAVLNIVPPLQEMPGLQGSRISSTDPRFQWLAFYRRDANASAIQVIVLAMRLHNTEPVNRYGTVAPYNTMEMEEFNRGNGPFLVRCRVIDSAVAADGSIRDFDDALRNEADRIVFTGSAADQDDFDQRVAGMGAFVVINHSPSTTDDPQRPFRNNGRVFRLGQRRTELDAAENGRVWDLVPGYDLPSAGAGADLIVGTLDDQPDPSLSFEEVDTQNLSTPATATAWMVGRGRIDPTADPAEINNFGGLVQDVSVLRVDVPLR